MIALIKRIVSPTLVAQIVGIFFVIPMTAQEAKSSARQSLSNELLRQIQSDFLQLSQPLNFTVKTQDDWTGVDALQRGLGAGPGKAKRVILSGDALEFKGKYPAPAIALALYPFFKDEAHDAEAYIIMSAVMDEREPMNFTSFRSRSDLGDWPQIRAIEAKGRRSSAASFGARTYHWSPMGTIYKVAQNEILPSSFKKKTKRGNWFSRLVSR